MRRQRDEVWETEVQGATERLRRVLGILAEQEAAFGTGTVPAGECLAALDDAARSTEAVEGWWQEWRVRTASLKTSRGVALSVSRSCLPWLIGAAETYRHALTLVALSPDPGDTDEDLARRGVRAAKEIALSALEFLDEIPSLRPVDRAAVDSSLSAVETRAQAMMALGNQIGSRTRELGRRGGSST